MAAGDVREGGRERIGRGWSTEERGECGKVLGETIGKGSVEGRETGREGREIDRMQRVEKTGKTRRMSKVLHLGTKH